MIDQTSSEVDPCSTADRRLRKYEAATHNQYRQVFKSISLELPLKDFSLQRSSSGENRVVADVCIYPPQDQLQRDQLYRDQLQRDQLYQDQLQRCQLQQREENQGDQVQRHRGENNQHEVSIYPDLNHTEFNHSRRAATEVCFPIFSLLNKT